MITVDVSAKNMKILGYWKNIVEYILKYLPPGFNWISSIGI